MTKTTVISGKAIPLAMDNIDTDLIIPAQYLTSVTRTGYGENLFKRLREADANFVFNQAKFAGANILISKNNFGCGSSREHAVWALQQAGIQAVIAVSFADIFFGNSAKNGLVLITLPEAVIDKMLAAAESGNYSLTIDLAQQKISSHENTYEFSMDPFRKHCLLNNLDELDYLLQHQAEIAAYEAKQAQSRYIPQTGKAV